MASQGENTPLLGEVPSNAGGTAPSSYYFLERANSHTSQAGSRGGSRDLNGGDAAFDASTMGEGDGDTEEVIDMLPEGSTGEEFASRPVMDLPKAGSTRSLSQRSQQRVGLFEKLFGKRGGERAPGFEATGPAGLIGSMAKQRKVQIKVEPKVFFANERTFLAWLHTSVLLAGASIAIVAFAESNPWSQLYGILLLPVAIAFICYAMYQYTRRASMIRRRDPGPYEDTLGPTLLGILLMMSIVAQFAIKLYTIL